MKTNKAPTSHKPQRAPHPLLQSRPQEKKTNKKERFKCGSLVCFHNCFIYLFIFVFCKKSSLTFLETQKKLFFWGRFVFGFVFVAYVWSCIWICVWSLIFFPCLVVFDVQSLSWWLFMPLYFFVSFFIHFWTSFLLGKGFCFIKPYSKLFFVRCNKK
jgi:hypothetical protein